MPLPTDKIENTPTLLSPWWIANMATKISVTSATISLATQPLGVVLSHSQAGNLSCLALSSLFKGLVPNIVAGQQRGLACVSAKVSAIGKVNDGVLRTNAEVDVLGKQNNEVEVLAKATDKDTSKSGSFYPMLLRFGEAGVFSQVELGLTTVHSNLSKLAQAKIIPAKSLSELGLANTKELFKMAYGFKSVSGIVGLSSLCILSDYMSNKFTYNNQVVNNLAGGASAGAISAVLTHPFVTAGDKTILGTNPNNTTGQLARKTQLMFFKDCKNFVKEVGIKKAVAIVMKDVAFELPIRTINGMIVFATIQSLMGVMGEEPLAPVWDRLFPKSEAQAASGLGEMGAVAPQIASIPESAEPDPEPTTGPYFY